MTEKNIMTNITLSEKEDRILKIKAAQFGTSKRKLATRITQEWLENQNIKTWISDLLKQISMMPDNDKLFDTVQDLIDSSIKLAELRTLKEVRKDFGREALPTDEEDAMRGKVVRSLEGLRSITSIPELDPDMFSFVLTRSYFKQ